MAVQTISAGALAELLASDPRLELIDVRTPPEYGEVHATPARNVPLDRLKPEEVAANRAASDKPLYVICKSGTRGKMACEKFQAAGFANVINVEGGTQAWEQSGLPVVRGRKTISLERQVRIAAGALVLIGAVLAVAVHPFWAGLSGFVGAGLIFAGITDTCGMAMLLARMPWNQSCRGATSCATDSTAAGKTGSRDAASQAA